MLEKIHYVKQCKHGIVIAQCKCKAKKKTVEIISCPIKCEGKD